MVHVSVPVLTRVHPEAGAVRAAVINPVRSGQPAVRFGHRRPTVRPVTSVQMGHVCVLVLTPALRDHGVAPGMVTKLAQDYPPAVTVGLRRLTARPVINVPMAPA